MKRKLLLTIVSFYLVTQVFAQSIKGRVEDEKKIPIVGATVIIEGTKKGSFTDAQGTFEIKEVKQIKQLNVFCEILFGIDPNQINILHTTVGGVRKSFELTTPKNSTQFNF